MKAFASLASVLGILGLGILGCLSGVVGCAGSPDRAGEQGIGSRFGVWDPPSDGSSRSLQAEERRPAGTPRTRWVPQSKILGVTPGGGTYGFVLDVSQVEEWVNTERRPASFIQPQLVRVEKGTCDGWDCSALRESGFSSAWDLYTRARREEKAVRLQNAVRGLSAPQAEKLVRYFKTKPTTWEAFAETIRKAERDGVLDGPSAYGVLVQSGFENLGLLGYQPSACKTTTYQCSTYKSQFVPVQGEQEVRVSQTRVLHREPRRFEVIVRNPYLQRFEHENIVVTAGADPDDVRISVDGYTHYEQRMAHRENVTRIELIGSRRIPADLPQAALLTARVQQIKNKPSLFVKVDPKYVPTETDDQLVLRYKVRTCRPYQGRCFGDWNENETRYVPLATAETAIDLDVDKGLRVSVQYSIARKNSKFYSEKFLAERETDGIRVF